MSRPRDKRPPQRASGPVQAPAELLLGALAEVWAEHGHRHDLGGSFGRYQRALRDWETSEGLTTAEMCAAVAVPRSPWSVATHDSEGRAAAADDRLARAGVTRADLPRLRRAAEVRTRTTEPSRRTP